jgi:serine/threonine protein kinase
MGVPFGRYELLERVAVGGMAEVFRARSVGRDGFSKEVCIKRILPGFCQEQDFVRMFIDEATLVARLQHANIVQIFDFDQVDGAYYIAMEFVNGRDLRNVIRLATQHQFPLGPFRSAVIAAEVCKGLHYAHQKDGIGLVHRDVSPHNVLLSHDGDVKVMDFGIAKAADRITRTSTGIIKGKIAYMAPEQAAAAVLDHRVDQFATGLVLFEMLTGRRAFDGPDAMALRRALSGEVEPPSLVSKEVPPELDEIFLRATRRNPEDRYPDMRAFERALLQFVYGRNLTEQDLDLAAYMRGLSDRVGAPTRTRVQEAMPEPSPVGAHGAGSQAAVAARRGHAVPAGRRTGGGGGFSPVQQRAHRGHATAHISARLPGPR